MTLLPAHKALLDRLTILLSTLPETLLAPIPSRYNFTDFVLTHKDITDYGLEGAVNHELEIRFGTRLHGLKLCERGERLEAVVNVFQYYLDKLPDSVLLKKWVDDVTTAAEDAYRDAGIEVSHEPGYRMRVQSLLTSRMLTL